MQEKVEQGLVVAHAHGKALALRHVLERWEQAFRLIITIGEAYEGESHSGVPDQMVRVAQSALEVNKS
jgi:hypothetical protein